MRSTIKDRVAAATVRLTKLGGQGVLVPGPYILTAAHCVKWSGTGGMALGDYFIETIRTRDGRTVKGSVDAAEPVADIAVIGAPDNQSLPEEWSEFLDFAENTEGVPLFCRALRLQHSLVVQVLTHKGKWVAGTATRYCYDLPTGTLSLRTDQPIKGGTSGGPVVTESGELVGIVSHSGGYDCTVSAPWLALPRWVLNKIAAAERVSAAAAK
jgi:S1-C subfamily serine protease